jgi:biopolymer transport protein ExbB
VPQQLPVLIDTTWRLVLQGGWIMLAVFVLGQIGWYYTVERWWRYRRETRGAVALLGDSPETPEALERRLLADPRVRGLFAAIVHGLAATRGHGRAAMVRKTREVLDAGSHGLFRGLGTIAVVASAAPLLGLAGTVAGIMMTFGIITLYGAGNPAMMAGGIARALMITEAALVVALPLVILHDRLHTRAEAIESDCIAGATHLIRLFSQGGSSRAAGSGNRTDKEYAPL